MKLLFIFSVLFSTSAFSQFKDSSCELYSYQKTINDYSGTCASLILDAAKEHKCSVQQLNYIKNRTNYAIQRVILKSTEFCKMESDNGYYSVMKDDMTEPPVATIFFSRWD